MRYFFLTLLMLIKYLAFSQESKKVLVYKPIPYELKYASTHINEIVNYNKNDSTVKMYVVDKKSLDTLIKLSTKPYKVVLFYTYWCSICRKELPNILSFIKTHEETFDLFMVTGDKYDKSPFKNKVSLNIHYLESELKYFNPVFLLDMAKYGNKDRGFSRIDSFIKETCNICNPKKMGYTAYFVYNPTNEIIFYSGYEDTNEISIDKLKKLKN